MCVRMPPLSDVADLAEAGILEGELGFVDEESGIGFALFDGVGDIGEEHGDVFEVWGDEVEGEECAGVDSGDGDGCGCVEIIE